MQQFRSSQSDPSVVLAQMGLMAININQPDSHRWDHQVAADAQDQIKERKRLIFQQRLQGQIDEAGFVNGIRALNATLPAIYRNAQNN